VTRVLKHDPEQGLSTLYFGDGELRVPMVGAAVGSGVLDRQDGTLPKMELGSIGCLDDLEQGTRLAR
jgi:hypothetical protein